MENKIDIEDKLITSFTIDHEKILPGIYVSRVDQIGEEFVTTFDIRMKKPNIEPCILPNAMHTIEHIVATYLRNEPEWADKIIYWGPMGCLTGNYLIVKGKRTSKEILPVILAAFKYLADYSGKIPGAEPECCGNYIMHDLNMARYEAKIFAECLENNPNLEYPTK